MKGLTGKRKLLRLFISNNDEYNGKPLWQCVLEKVKEKGLSGATVYKAVAGIGSHSKIHSFSIWRLSQNVPIIVEVIDREEKIKELVAILDNVVEEGLIVMEDVNIISYKHKG